MADDHDHENEDALRAVAERFYEIACRCLTNDGHVQFVNMVRMEDAEIPVIFSDSDGMTFTDKDVIERAIRSMAPQCTWIAQVAEAWTLNDFSTYNPTLAVSEHPERAEGIFVNVQSRKGTYMIMSVFERDDQGNPLRPTIQNKGFVSHDESNIRFSGRMTNYYTNLSVADDVGTVARE